MQRSRIPFTSVFPLVVYCIILFASFESHFITQVGLKLMKSSNLNLLMLGLLMWATILITLYVYYILSQQRNFYWYNLLALFRSHKFCMYTCVCVKSRLVCLVLYILVMYRLCVPLCHLPPSFYPSSPVYSINILVFISNFFISRMLHKWSHKK